MSTTSLKLPAELKLRAAAAAKNQGMSPHAFMVGAIEQAATAAEQRATFVAEAAAARNVMRESGVGYAADEVHDYLRRRAAGQKADRPPAKPWRD